MPVQRDEKELMIPSASHPRGIPSQRPVSGTLFCLLVCLQHTNRHCHTAPSSTQHICTYTAMEVLTGSQGADSMSVSQIKQRP